MVTLSCEKVKQNFVCESDLLAKKKKEVDFNIRNYRKHRIWSRLCQDFPKCCKVIS